MSIRIPSFSDFLSEGGNVKIGDVEADRINLKEVERKDIVKMLDRSLSIINAHFKRFSGEPLWIKELFRSKQFLSGSSLHFFNKQIPDSIFAEKKPTVGDIDTQIDKNMAEQVKKWLDSLNNTRMGYLTFVGYKSSAGQYITLWTIDKYNLNIQIDLEMVDYENKMPTSWSIFSHSSSWDDIQASVKGVFHKYLLRALTSKNMKEITLLKGKKETPTKVVTGTHSFSVALGLRKKLEPTEVPNTYKELATKDSKYITNLEEIFYTLFGHTPTTAELKQFESFVGVLKLIKKYFSPSEIDNVVLGFSLLLWDKGAQRLVRGNPKEDYETKRAAYDLLLKELGRRQPKEVDAMIDSYYKAYK